MNYRNPLCLLLVSVTGSAVAQNVMPINSDELTPEMITQASPIEMPEVWTYDDCVNWASANNTEIRRTILNILSARQDILSAKDAWLPTVNFNTSQSYTNFPVPEVDANGNTYGSSYNVGATWTAWDGNVRKYRRESAQLMERQQILAGDDVLRQLRLGILEAYLNILYSGEAVEIARQTLEVSTSQAARSQKLMEAGRVSKVEYAQLESQRAGDAYALTQAQSNYEVSKMALKKILELGIDHSINVADISMSDDEILAPLPDRVQVCDIAAGWLPQFKSNEINKDLYTNDVKIAKAGMMPTITLQGNVGTGYTSGGPGWGHQMGHNLNENIGVSINVPIFDGNATKRAVAKSKLAAMEYDLTRKNLMDDLSQNIESLYIDAANARAQYQSGLVQLESMQLTDDLVNRQFELGLVNPLELLTAHNNLLNARLELLQSKYMSILANKSIMYYATQEVNL